MLPILKLALRPVQGLCDAMGRTLSAASILALLPRSIVPALLGCAAVLILVSCGVVTTVEPRDEPDSRAARRSGRL